MTPQEQQLIDGLIQRVNNTRPADKDTDAEQHLQQGLRSNPDALYTLAQTVIVQQLALEQAQKQLSDLRQQLDQSRENAATPQKHTSFLGSIFGSSDPEPQRPAPPPPPPQTSLQGNSGYQPVPNSPAYGQPSYSQPTYAPATGGGMLGGGGGGFLRGAAQTAAGVAAGALAFEGVESLLHGFGNSMVGGERGFDAGAPREEVVNNYYGDSGNDRGFDDRGNNDRGNDDRGNNDRNFADADRGDNNADPGSNIFTDADNNASDDQFSDSNDGGNFDDSGSGLDDSGSGFDDGGSDLSGGDDSSF